MFLQVRALLERVMMRPRFVFCALVGVIALATEIPTHAVAIVVTPGTVKLRVSSQQAFTATVWQTTNKSVVWKVNGIVGGNPTVGTITQAGLYSAPPAVPATNPVTVSATTAADADVSESVVVTILQPLPTIASLTPPNVPPGPFVVTIIGSGFVPQSAVSLGEQLLSTTFVSSTQLIVRGTGSLVVGGFSPVSVTNPEPGSATSNIVAMQIRPAAALVTPAAAARFLHQVSWGPTPESIARVQQLGFASYLDEQFAASPSIYPDQPLAVNLTGVQQRFLQNAITGQDQLRQRVAFALSQIFVVSGLKNPTPTQFVPYLRLLHDLAFSNYATLIHEVTLSPSMGRFLDLAFNEKANAAGTTRPNENYARELLQLFTIGTERLNQDGTRQLSGGVPILTYDQDTVQSFARALTGWTFPTAPGQVPQTRNPQYFVGRMEPVEKTHDTGQKILLNGVVVPAGQTPEEDLADVVANVFAHLNVGPFVAQRLIQHLVTSNPSPAYVGRVAAAFNGVGGQRGDMKGVIKAIVLDPEARLGDTPGAAASSTSGHLREPALYVLAILRSLGATISDFNRIPGLTVAAGQSLFYAPSVLNYFSPLHDVPQWNFRGPEFQIHTPSAAVYRANIAYFLAYGSQSIGVSLDLTPFELLASNPALLVESLNQSLLAGAMPPQARQIIEQAVSASPSHAGLRAQVAVYLAASSSAFQVQR